MENSCLNCCTISSITIVKRLYVCFSEKLNVWPLAVPVARFGHAFNTSTTSTGPSSVPDMAECTKGAILYPRPAAQRPRLWR